MKDCKANVSKIETFGSVDGPGVRFVVFMQGCNMRCKYCHNPETWCLNAKTSMQYTASELFEIAFKYRHYWGKDMTNGGITVSGGEPLLQIDFLIEFFTLAKQHGVHTAIDTSGQPFLMEQKYLEKFNQLMAVTDLFIVDIKAFDSVKHKELTGYDNKNILEMLKYLSKNNIDVWIRRVLVPNLTDEEQDLLNTKNFISSLGNVKRVEILPYQTLGVYKWVNWGLNYPLKDFSSPNKSQVERAKRLLGLSD